jgi:hypothetical protein
VFILCLCCLVCRQRAALRRGHPPSKESYRLCKKSRNWKSGQGQTKGYTIIIIIIISGVRLSPWYCGHYWPIVPVPDGDYGAIGGMKIGRVNQSSRRKLAPVQLCPPQIPHDLTRARTRAATVGNQRLTAWVMARPTKGCKAIDR